MKRLLLVLALAGSGPATEKVPATSRITEVRLSPMCAYGIDFVHHICWLTCNYNIQVLPPEKCSMLEHTFSKER